MVMVPVVCLGAGLVREGFARVSMARREAMALVAIEVGDGILG